MQTQYEIDKMLRESHECERFVEVLTKQFAIKTPRSEAHAVVESFFSEIRTMRPPDGFGRGVEPVTMSRDIKTCVLANEIAAILRRCGFEPRITPTSLVDEYRIEIDVRPFHRNTVQNAVEFAARRR